MRDSPDRPDTRVVVTGIGCVSPYGPGRERLWNAAVGGEDGLRPLTRFNASNYRNTLAGEVPDHPAIDALLAQGHPRAVAYVLLAADEALAQAGLPTADGPEPVTGGAGPVEAPALVLGSNFGPMRPGEAAFARRLAHPDNPAADLTAYLSGSVLAALRARLDAHWEQRSGIGATKAPEASERMDGPRAAAPPPEAMLSLSCASGAAALGVALNWLREGRAGVALAGGFDELSETAFAGLSALRAISRDTVRPFDKGRDGTIFAEGAGLFVLETAEHAARRGAAVLAELAGSGLNNDAFHMTAPDQSAAGIARVMRMALADAGLAPGEVDHVNLHGTGTPYNDRIETKAMRDVFGARVAAMRFTANKSLFGHAMGAAGSLEAALTALSLARATIAPTIRSREADPELDLPLVRGAAEAFAMRAALSNSYGLGGANACLAFRRASENAASK